MFFGWQKTLVGVSPVIVWDKLHGCSSRMEFDGGLHPVKPEHQRMTIDELAVIFPAPVPKPE